MKFNTTTAIVIGVAIVALLFFMNGAGAFTPKAYVALAYDNGAGSSAYSMAIVVATNGSSTDITTTPIKYAGGQVDKIVGALHCDVNLTINNASPSDQIKVTFTAQWNQATYGSGSIASYGYTGDLATYTVTLSGNQFLTSKSMIISADSVANQWARQYVRCIDLYNGIPTGKTYTLSMPVIITVQLVLNGANQAIGSPQQASLIGTATVTNNALAGNVVVTTATISTQYVALNIFAH